MASTDSTIPITQTTPTPGQGDQNPPGQGDQNPPGQGDPQTPPTPPPPPPPQSDDGSSDGGHSHGDDLPYCEPSVVPITLELSPMITLFVDPPKVKVINCGLCKPKGCLKYPPPS